MELWEVRKKHYDDYWSILKKNGWVEAGRRIRTFISSVFWPEFYSLGHSTTEFETCECFIKFKGESNT